MEVHINAWGLDRSYQALETLEVQTNFIRDEMIVDLKEDDISEDDKKLPAICTPYNGQYDNLLFFFTHMYRMIHTRYDHNELIAYRRPIL